MQTFAKHAQQASSLVSRLTLSLRPRGVRVAPLLLAALALMTSSGCEDNPANPGNGPVCEHVDADGLLVETSAGTLLLHQWEGTVSGEIEVDEGETLSGLQVWFLDADSVRTRPTAACVEHVLRWTVGDTSIVELAAVSGEPWAFDLHGREEGETTVRLLVEHGGHVDFTSLPLSVHVLHHDGEHSEPEGVVLRAAGLEVVRAAEGVVTGSLSAATGQLGGEISVFFLDADDDEFVPDDPDIELRVEIADDGIVTATVDDDWTFRLTGVVEGTTTLQIVVWHDGHADYTSPAIVVDVGASVTVGSVLVTDGPDWVAADNFNVNGSWGPILVRLGQRREQLEVRVPAEAGLDYRFTQYLDLPTGYHLQWDIADPSKISIQGSVTAPMGLDIGGIALGRSSVQLRIMNGSTTVYTTNPIDVVVFESGQGDPAPTFQMRLNGRTELGVIDGVLQDIDSFVCASKVWTAGFAQSLSAVTGPLTELIALRVFDDTCTRIDYSTSTHHIAFLFSSRGVARTAHHPEHVGEKLEFHIEGIVPGSTEVTVVLLVTATSEVLFVSPPLPVTILA